MDYQNNEEIWNRYDSYHIYLDDYIYTRYEYTGKMFKLVRQIKQGNEYFSTLIETDN